MPFTRILAAGAVTLAAAGGAVAVVTASGQAQSSGKTYVITPVGRESLAFTDAAPKGFRRNRSSLGDQLMVTTKIKRDGSVAGTEQATITISDPHPVHGDRAHGVVSGVYHLTDGDLYFAGTMLLDASEKGVGAITGGTGAYIGARGTIEPGHARDVIHLLP